MNYKEKWEKRDAKVNEFCKEIGKKTPYRGFYVGEGWLPIVFAALKEMSLIDIEWELAQVKQKFCQLRIYIDFLNTNIYKEEHPQHSKYKEVMSIIDRAVTLCDVACEECGTEVAGGPACGTKLCKVCCNELR